MKDIFLIDFDGTIAFNDSTHLLANRFIPKKYEYYRQKFSEGKVNVKKFVYDLLTSLNIDQETFRKTLHQEILVDKSFKDFIDKDIEVRIVSAGTKFNVIYSLESIDLDFNEANIYANDIFFNGNEIELQYPYLDKSEENGVDKASIIYKYRDAGYRVIFVGDGPSDYMAAKEADIVYARKGTRLEKKCREYNINFMTFSDFNELYANYLNNYRVRQENCVNSSKIYV
ncbi:HAD-IB family phosphatase [Brassicibacter mesophilus]|uniref:HAD-IB family phosphatase n=1 Tax=Brassicibacter mesophilus TaxID=745119 RepID=UPI003D1DA589